MYIVADSLDDLMHRVLSRLLKKRKSVKTHRKDAVDIIGALLRIRNPADRLSRTEQRGRLFSAIGELFWYLAKSDQADFITYYIPGYAKEAEEDGHIHGAYGPRLFALSGINQVENVISLLTANPTSRRAAIQLFDASDIAGPQRYNDIPCTCTMQFMIRDKRLNMVTYMRSNDAFLGLPHDIFTFTMLQEIIARSLDCNLGTYSHAVGNLHLYKSDRKAAKQYLEEGWQESVKMPPMPPGDPWPSIRKMVALEDDLRNGRSVDIKKLSLERYWQDIAYLLQIYSHKDLSESSSNRIAQIRNKISVRIYDPYIRRRQASKRRPTTSFVPHQGKLL